MSVLWPSKYAKIRFWPGLCPGPRLGSSWRSPRPLSQLERGHPFPDPTPLGTDPPSALAMRPPRSPVRSTPMLLGQLYEHTPELNKYNATVVCQNFYAKQWNAAKSRSARPKTKTKNIWVTKFHRPDEIDRQLCSASIIAQLKVTCSLHTAAYGAGYRKLGSGLQLQNRSLADRATKTNIARRRTRASARCA